MKLEKMLKKWKKSQPAIKKLPELTKEYCAKIDELFNLLSEDEKSVYLNISKFIKIETRAKEFVLLLNDVAIRKVKDERLMK